MSQFVISSYPLRSQTVTLELENAICDLQNRAEIFKVADCDLKLT